MSHPTPKKYDSTVARIAGNIASGLAERAFDHNWEETQVAGWCVRMAREIVAATERTEPKAEGQ